MLLTVLVSAQSPCSLCFSLSYLFQTNSHSVTTISTLAHVSSHHSPDLCPVVMLLSEGRLVDEKRRQCRSGYKNYFLSCHVKNVSLSVATKSKKSKVCWPQNASCGSRTDRERGSQVRIYSVMAKYINKTHHKGKPGLISRVTALQGS